MIRSGTVSDRRRRRPTLAAGIVLLAAVGRCTVAPSAVAQPSATDRRQAEALFLEAKKLEKAGKIPEACRKFEGSYKIDPAGGTALNLALCHEKEGKIATAWAELREALALAKKAKRRDRVRIAEEHIEALEPRLPYFVVIPVQPDTPGLAVTVDDGPIAGEAWGAQIPIDPGKHKVKATAPDHEPWEGELDAQEQKKVTIRVPGLKAVVRPAPTPAAPPPLAFPWMRPSGIAIGSVGVAAVVVGAIFGGRAVSLAETAKQGCSASLSCTPEGFAAVQEGRASATASDVLLGAGAGLAVIGAVFFVAGGRTAPVTAGAARVAPLVRTSASGAIVGLEGAW